MTQRRRMSRAQVERTPGREVRPGVSAATWWGDDTIATPITTERLEVPFTMDVLESAIARLNDNRALAFAGQAIADARRRADAAEARREAMRRAVERTGRALVAWLIGRWRR